MSSRTDGTARLGQQAGSGVSAVYREQTHRVNDAEAEDSNADSEHGASETAMWCEQMVLRSTETAVSASGQLHG